MGIEYKSKLIHPDEISELVRELKQQNKRVVSLNGSFDLMHAGHLFMLFEAKKQGDILIVALNTDDSIKKYKSVQRPIIPLEYRMEMMAAISAVDYVTYFDETDPIRILEKIQPDVHVNGAEYGADCIEASTVKALGAKLHLVERIPSLSTTAIINKIRKLCD